MRAEAREQLRRYPEAAEDYRQAVALSPPAEQSRFRPKYAVALARAAMVAEAVAEVAELTKLPNWNATRWYDFACVYAIASGKIADKNAEFADRAMELLQKTVKAGYKDVGHLKQDKVLDPLRERDDFKKLLTELQKK